MHIYSIPLLKKIAGNTLDKTAVFLSHIGKESPPEKTFS